MDDNDARQLPHRTRCYARLYRIDLDRHSSTPLALFRYRNTSGIDAIAVMPDGLLALVVGRRHAYSVWRLDGRGDHAEFRGVTAGRGQVIDAPVMGEDGLYLPVMRHGKLHVLGLGSGRFHGGRGCDEL